MYINIYKYISIIVKLNVQISTEINQFLKNQRFIFSILIKKLFKKNLNRYSLTI